MAANGVTVVMVGRAARPRIGDGWTDRKANQMRTVCIDTITRKHTLSQKLPLTPVVPKPSE